MAITIHITYSGENDNAVRFAQEMLREGVVEEIRAQAGNLRYEYFLPLEGAGSILLIDSWSSQDALDAHHQSAMMQKIIALREKYDLHMKVERCISDAAGIPEQDRVFVKE